MLLNHISKKEAIKMEYIQMGYLCKRRANENNDTFIPNRRFLSGLQPVKNPRSGISLLFYFRFFVHRMLTVKGAILIELQFFLSVAAVFLRRVIFALTLRALQRNKFNSTFFLCSHALNSL
jgi:hypothetical protein